jgi:hypothetical protein
LPLLRFAVEPFGLRACRVLVAVASPSLLPFPAVSVLRLRLLAERPGVRVAMKSSVICLVA